MDSAHVFEPNFHIISSGQHHIPGKNIPDTAARMLFGLLERLYLCHAPRILSAYCLTEKPDMGRYEA
ncbi:MAG: hypothetical protein FWG04_01825 [Desulfovibrionaceae bacterium]|nr:hypothetical protein [Desulfovibrionaceae bacterium]